LRARAIENHTFVLAPAQCGVHGNGRKSWGHSMAIDPFGKILVDGGIDPGVNFVDIDVSLAKNKST
jgi:predicted amidohydrolase